MTTILGTRQLHWPDEAACAEAAAGLAVRIAGLQRENPSAGVVIELRGPLGAGKTTFARHLLHALGVAGTVKSPTYTLLEPYAADAAHGGFAISHFDFYRFEDPNEWEEAGFRDVFAAPGLKLVEWPEMAGDLLPPADLVVTLLPVAGQADARSVRLTAASEIGAQVIADPDDTATP